MAESPKQVLSLDTLAVHDTVGIDGVPYDLANASELSILDYHRIGRYGEQVNGMMGLTRDLTDEEVVLFRGLLDSMCQVVLRAPPDVHERLTDSQRLQIITVFTHRSEIKAPVPEPMAAPVQTGGS